MSEHESVQTRGDQRHDLVVGDTNSDGAADVWVADTDGDGKAVTVSAFDQRRIEDKANEHLQRRAA